MWRGINCVSCLYVVVGLLLILEDRCGASDVRVELVNLTSFGILMIVAALCLLLRLVAGWWWLLANAIVLDVAWFAGFVDIVRGLPFRGAICYVGIAGFLGIGLAFSVSTAILIVYNPWRWSKV